MKKFLLFIIFTFIFVFLYTPISIFAFEYENSLKEEIEIICPEIEIQFDYLDENRSPYNVSRHISADIFIEFLPAEKVNLINGASVDIAKVYYYKNNIFNIDTISSASNDLMKAKKEIVNFCRERIQNLSQNNISARSVDSSLFTYVTSGYKRIVHQPDGYMDHTYTVRKYRVDNITSLFIVETNSDFVPGSIAYQNGDTSYNKKMRNDSGYIHVNAEQAVVQIDQSMTRYGGVPVYKDSWPVNSPGVITITSTYNVGVNLGYSFKNGFSLDNISLENQFDYGANISHSYSKAYTSQEPRFSSQHDSNNYNMYQWSYQYVDNVNGDETFHFNTGYMFELNNSGHGLSEEGQFALKLNFRMRVCLVRDFLWDSIQNPFDGELNLYWW